MHKIMVVDDSAFMRTMLKEILEQRDDCEVVCIASNGIEAIHKYKVWRPDLVIMDILMPEMDGLDATKKIIAFDPNAKIIVCSVMGERSVIMKAIHLGAADFMVKPIQRSRVLDAVNKVMNRRKKIINKINIIS